MSGPKTPADVLGPMFSRGELPVAIIFAKDYGPCKRGDVLAWVDQSRGFVTVDDQYVFRADFVRDNLGSGRIFAALTLQEAATA